MSDMTLSDSLVATRLPAQDLDRARAFYADVLGLEPVEERPGGLLYRCRSGMFALYQTAARPSGAHTQMGFEVDDLRAVAAVLRARGVVLEEVTVPGLETVDGIAEVTGNYPSKGTGELACWFRDSEGNLLGCGQPTGPCREARTEPPAR
jgi:catechol 2,3-dioxygenase-like lactoylglutathione lyase family enzyme